VHRLEEVRKPIQIALIEFQEAREVDLASAAGTEVPSGEQVRSTTAPTEPLKLGSIMSITGDLADFGPPIQDAAQAEVLAELADELGYTNVCVLYVNTPYGQGLSEGFTTEFEALGGKVSNQVSVEAQQTTYVAELQKCVGG